MSSFEISNTSLDLILLLLFIEQRIDVLEAQKNEDGNSTAKPIKEFQDVELYEIWEDKTLHVYLIAGKKEIFLLGEDEANWAHKLSDQEIESFPVEIYYTGPETNFEVNSKTTTELRKSSLLFGICFNPVRFHRLFGISLIPLNKHVQRLSDF